jgi:hypothetical protein
LSMEYPYDARQKVGCSLSTAIAGTNKKGGPQAAFPLFVIKTA